MRIARNLRLSLHALSTHRMRTALAVAGTMVGVAGVVVLTAIGTGARGQVLDRIDSLGRNMLVVSAAKVEARGGRTRQGVGWIKTLQVDDARAILSGSGAVVRAAPADYRALSAKFGRISNRTTVLGTTPDWLAIRRFALAQGRFFTEAENAARTRVAVLGWDARANLFPDSVNPVGRTIRIGSVMFEVIGVLASKGVSVEGTATEDDRIIVPLETALRRLFNVDYVKLIYLEATSADATGSAGDDAAAILRVRHDLPAGGRDDFTIQNQRVLLAAELAAKTSFQRLIMGLGFLSLVVGGVGILSIMLLSVRERRNEIGLRIALGARRRDLLVQFLAEALMLAGAGGVLGMLLGVAGAALVSSATAWDARVSGTAIVIAVSSVVAIGIGFGVLPAWRAARLEPIAALQAE
jgi:putative ABC transport system permease protein